MCVKRQYDSPTQAKAARRTLRTKGRKTDWDRVHVYRCDRCRRWHLGHRWER